MVFVFAAMQKGVLHSERLLSDLPAAAEFVWGPFMLCLLAGAGVFLSCRLGFPQLRHPALVLRKTLGSLHRNTADAEGGQLSPFEALATALGASVGTGNIAGVTAAIFLGGPGAVFWMWVSALFGMATKYAEIVLALDSRVRDEHGAWRGGAMYYIERGLGKRWRWLALLFALAGGLACFGIGNVVQSSEFAGAVQSLFGLQPGQTGLILCAAVSASLLGGVRRIGRIAARLVPFMAGAFFLLGLGVVIVRFQELPELLLLILRSAFRPAAAGSGALGFLSVRALRQGVSRGLFSHEAGLGSAPMAHAASACRDPCEQGLWGILEVFIDTFVICTVTALCVLLSGVWETPGGLDAFPSAGAAAAEAFQLLLPGAAGRLIVPVGLLLFSFSSILCWGYYGDVCWSYLFGGRKPVSAVFRLLFSAACIAGAAGAGRSVWAAADALNALMAAPNLLALLLLSGRVAVLSWRYFSREQSRRINQKEYGSFPASGSDAPSARRTACFRADPTPPAGSDSAAP